MSKPAIWPDLELWGGAECTVNRVGDRYRDQSRETGHHDRAGDIALFAELGLSAVRLPVLWERVCPHRPDAWDWAWSDRCLGELKQAHIRPIIGLIHHGSGPAYTSLIDDGFASGLASHAAAVAERYPGVEDWTPVNEPLTTARFAALYGHWYPHLRDERQFWIALLNQIDATRLAMRAIRRVNPKARLIQTDDLGRTYGTAAMADQAAFDNVRRWMSWDLLCGRVIPGHDLWHRLAGFGLGERLRAIADDPSPPDIIGINHYLTSDRLLDHRIQRYPESVRGGNGQRAYADVEAVRVLEPPPQGLAGAIAEAWARYHTPIALTEIHNGCTRDEQLRWLREAWQAALDARASGIDVRAVTPWALFGNRGWNTLLTSDGVYEPGAFDVSADVPRRTALADLIKALPGDRQLAAPIGGHGWWRRGARLLHPAASRPAPMREQARQNPPDQAAPILITGASGTLGQALGRACVHRDLRFVLTGRDRLDLQDEDSIADALDRYRPWAVINAAGWVRVDDAEAEAEACHAVNATGAAALAELCAKRGIRTINFSSDLVFDGAKDAPYAEGDPVAPLNIYGQSKAAMEAAVLGLEGAHLVIRTAAFFSPFDRANFAWAAKQSLSRGERFAAAADCAVTPTYVPDLCDATLDLLIDGETGLWHLSNQETVSWAEFARRIAQACGLDDSLIAAVPAADLDWRARRPERCGIISQRGRVMPTFASALARFAAAA